MTREEEKNKARFEYVSKRLANPDYPTYNDEYELECAYDAGAMWADSYPHWISVEEELPLRMMRELLADLDHAIEQGENCKFKVRIDVEY